MPKVKALTKAQQQAERNHAGNVLVLEILAAYKAREGKFDQHVADALGWKINRITTLKKNPGAVPLEKLRAFLQVLDVTPEQWLRIGGFEVDK